MVILFETLFNEAVVQCTTDLKTKVQIVKVSKYHATNCFYSKCRSINHLSVIEYQ